MALFRGSDCAVGDLVSSPSCIVLVSVGRRANSVAAIDRFRDEQGYVCVRQPGLLMCKADIVIFLRLFSVYFSIADGVLILHGPRMADNHLKHQ